MTKLRHLFMVALLLTSTIGTSQEQKTIQFFQTDWGRTITWDAFCEKTAAAGYDGIEIWFPNSLEDQENLKAALTKHHLKVGFINGTNKSVSFEESLKSYETHLRLLTTWSPVYINNHTVISDSIHYKC